ncbi:YihY/virulence factor BrkB family protein [Streptacidiphilus neutrinimicus]|uniref:YihY/virulence factor BrkB family protein n=1 Tax=Streptacidiphilus neutrinimicus TaxID=105420 RepID=UPI0005A9659F|nr:YihY/virulence factor BrkB family protein [Streptacidiphilus neutrinimicus]
MKAWSAALRRTPASMWNDDLTDDAAALTYYAILAVLPALLVLVLAFDLISPGTAQAFIASVSAYAPGPSGAQLHAALAGVTTQRPGIWTVLAAGGASALWSSSSYLAVFRRTLHRMHHVPDPRSAWRRAHQTLLTALTLLALLAASALVLLLSGPVADALGRALHLGEGISLAWSAARWPVLLCLFALLVAVVFHTGPGPARGSRHSVPGGALAAVLWLSASAAFTFYVSALGAYSRLYGSLAGIVVFLIWLWLSNLALLTGAQFTAELSKEKRTTSEVATASNT